MLPTEYRESHLLRKYFYNGQLSEEAIIVNGRRHGVCRRFLRNGQILLETHYEEGLPHGRNRIWFPNGQLGNEEFFINGFRNGTQKEWYQDGNIKCQAEYLAGRLHGLRQSWHRNGRLKAEELFNEQRLHGVSRYWDAEGHIQSRATYRAGRLHGERLKWDITGKEVVREYYSRGVRIPRRYEVLILNDRLKAKHIFWIKNAEVRRICLEALGYAQFLAQMPHSIVHRDADQELVRISWFNHEEPVFVVKVRCPSTGAYYVLRVPPGMKTVRQAVAWTFGLNEEEYQPTKES